MKQYQAQQGEKQKALPGYYYVKGIDDFFKQHYRVGELYMEYIKGGCTESGPLCSFCNCNQWIGPQMQRIPQPYPSNSNAGHYEDVFDTPCDGRNVDDYAPRANLKKLFKRCEISSKSHQAIADFCSQYIVTPEAASLYIKHMEELKFSSELRAGERAKSKAAMRDKCFDDFEWKDLISDNSIAKLTVAQLRLYLDKFNLSKVGYKKDKVERIKAHFYLQDASIKQKKTLNIPLKDGSSDESSDDDEVIAAFGPSTSCNDSSSSSSEDSDIDQESINVYTHSGRRAGSWKNCFSRC